MRNKIAILAVFALLPTVLDCFEIWNYISDLYNSIFALVVVGYVQLEYWKHSNKHWLISITISGIVSICIVDFLHSQLLAITAIKKYYMNGIKMDYCEMYDNLTRTFDIYLAYNQLILMIIFVIFTTVNLCNLNRD